MLPYNISILIFSGSYVLYSFRFINNSVDVLTTPQPIFFKEKGDCLAKFEEMGGNRGEAFSEINDYDDIKGIFNQGSQDLFFHLHEIFMLQH